jgi:hypothetical protein
MQESFKQQSATMRTDQQGRRGMAERLYDSNGVLSDDRIRNAAIEDYRRATAAITATTSAIEAATADFRGYANQNYPSIVSTIQRNQERSGQLAEDTKVISNNTDAISRARTQYSNLYRADQWQSQRDEPDYSQQRRSSRENLNHTAFSLVASSESSAEFTRNLRDIEKNIVQIKEQQKEINKSQSKQDRDMDFGI